MTIPHDTGKQPGVKKTPAPAKPPQVKLPKLMWDPSPNHSDRHGSKVTLVVCHRPVGSYTGSIATLKNPARQASAHVVTEHGGLEATQLVRWDDKAWACAEYNSQSDNIEFSDDMWVGLDPHGLAVAAVIVAQRCKARGIPRQWTKTPGKPGVIRHYDLGGAGGGHTDPTTDDQIWQRFINLVKAVDLSKVPAVWGK